MIPVVSRRKMRAACRILSTSSHGKTILRDLRRTCFVDTPSYQPGADPALVGFREGMRTVYLRLTQYAEMSDEELLALVQTGDEDDE